MNKEEIKAHLSEAKAALAEKNYSDYWTAVNKAAALMGAGDSAEADDEITDKINQALKGPGSEGEE